MASEVFYAKVSPKERENFISGDSDTGDQVTYAEVNVTRRSDTPASTPKMTRSVTCLESSPWCYVVLALCFCAAVLLLAVVLLAVKCYSRRAG